MTYYAIRHKPSGRFFPVFAGGQRRGSTHLNLPFTGTPRLFATELAAVNCLRWWLKGAFTTFYKYDGEEECVEEITKPVEDRHADDMEILQVDVVPQ